MTSIAGVSGTAIALPTGWLADKHGIRKMFLSARSIVSPLSLRRQNSDSIIKILNEAWAFFWNNPDDFRKWEEKSIDKLKSSI